VSFKFKGFMMYDATKNSIPKRTRIINRLHRGLTIDIDSAVLHNCVSEWIKTYKNYYSSDVLQAVVDKRGLNILVSEFLTKDELYNEKKAIENNLYNKKIENGHLFDYFRCTKVY
jgi:hypothetical protein